MKKKLLIISLITFSALVSTKGYAISSQDFIKKFSTCSYHVENSENRISAILGWSTRKCYYKEITHLETVTCGFKQLELQNVVNAMKKEKYDHTKGITSLTSIDYYLNSPEVCTIDSKNDSKKR